MFRNASSQIIFIVITILTLAGWWFLAGKINQNNPKKWIGYVFGGILPAIVWLIMFGLLLLDTIPYDYIFQPEE